ncbi:UNVERIFIED_CONTAM: putative carotenoid cleavage dioxygenase 4, chloroplastic [Sesamum angustifolium]|uniref:Carotenoid cleavage dioxygenase 4, chloroplastic n=1 Tax=Sesamum angustifolium TaxID=2727405 RepID=A0AAW2MB67_9LAMI
MQRTRAKCGGWMPGFNMLHCFNAWEEDGGDTIVMVASNLVSVDQQSLESVQQAQLIMEKLTINVKSKTLQRQPLSRRVLDFGGINPAYAAKEKQAQMPN